ncbi:hypothetical protein PPERSA_08815 [Pseudocohnilembus persalinus]|uniref:Uncharacterized protein n=1 Tax=Pseudocohnilembus persalinus TaxID=266149 RepID=A0A0V0R3P2_PSEPJ|nr:hypothetical protein PPERSA_08815 [Pseudocohnilembus persalinus]|eukprot:KRX09099.1 hypothetical protein PPERSA_08815 [Pseudocohnilembus persalinus]
MSQKYDPTQYTYNKNLYSQNNFIKQQTQERLSENIAAKKTNVVQINLPISLNQQDDKNINCQKNNNESSAKDNNNKQKDINNDEIKQIEKSDKSPINSKKSSQQIYDLDCEPIALPKQYQNQNQNIVLNQNQNQSQIYQNHNKDQIIQTYKNTSYPSKNDKYSTQTYKGYQQSQQPYTGSYQKQSYTKKTNVGASYQLDKSITQSEIIQNNQINNSQVNPQQKISQNNEDIGQINQVKQDNKQKTYQGYQKQQQSLQQIIYGNGIPFQNDNGSQGNYLNNGQIPLNQDRDSYNNHSQYVNTNKHLNNKNDNQIYQDFKNQNQNVVIQQFKQDREKCDGNKNQDQNQKQQSNSKSKSSQKSRKISGLKTLEIGQKVCDENNDKMVLNQDNSPFFKEFLSPQNNTNYLGDINQFNQTSLTQSKSQQLTTSQKKKIVPKSARVGAIVNNMSNVLVKNIDYVFENESSYINNYSSMFTSPIRQNLGNILQGFSQIKSPDPGNEEQQKKYVLNKQKLEEQLMQLAQENSELKQKLDSTLNLESVRSLKSAQIYNILQGLEEKDNEEVQSQEENTQKQESKQNNEVKLQEYQEKPLELENLQTDRSHTQGEVEKTIVQNQQDETEKKQQKLFDEGNNIQEAQNNTIKMSLSQIESSDIIQQLKEQINTLDKKLKSANEEINQLKEVKQEKKQEFKDTDKNDDLQKQQIIQLKEQLEQNEKNHQQQMQEIKGNYEVILEQEKDNNEKQIKQLKQLLEEAQNQNQLSQSVVKENQNHKEKMQKLNEQNSQLEEQNENLKMEKQEIQMREQKLQREINNLKQQQDLENQQIQKEREEFKEQISKLQLEIAQKRKKISTQIIEQEQQQIQQNGGSDKKSVNEIDQTLESKLEKIQYDFSQKLEHYLNNLGLKKKYGKKIVELENELMQIKNKQLINQEQTNLVQKLELENKLLKEKLENIEISQVENQESLEQNQIQNELKEEIRILKQKQEKLEVQLQQEKNDREAENTEFEDQQKENQSQIQYLKKSIKKKDTEIQILKDTLEKNQIDFENLSNSQIFQNKSTKFEIDQSMKSSFSGRSKQEIRAMYRKISSQSGMTAALMSSKRDYNTLGDMVKNSDNYTNDEVNQSLIKEFTDRQLSNSQIFTDSQKIKGSISRKSTSSRRSKKQIREEYAKLKKMGQNTASMMSLKQDFSSISALLGDNSEYDKNQIESVKEDIIRESESFSQDENQIQNKLQQGKSKSENIDLQE